ncbi:hypothetical protein [Bifidobacterium leontopitheci]|nr:hypothetical protein [Bifidobacterium leontopitheci]
MIVAVTGHQRIPAQAMPYVRRGVRDYLASRLVSSAALQSAAAVAFGGGASGAVSSGATLVSCLAVGADQLTADIALRLGYDLTAMIPARGYETTFDEVGLYEYQRLVRQASRTVTLDFDHPCGEAYMAAGLRLLDACDELLAVWDGYPSAGLGGTGDVVTYARHAGIPVHVVWPAGVRH